MLPSTGRFVDHPLADATRGGWDVETMIGKKPTLAGGSPHAAPGHTATGLNPQSAARIHARTISAGLLAWAGRVCGYLRGAFPRRRGTCVGRRLRETYGNAPFFMCLRQ